jgi:cold shock protein
MQNGTVLKYVRERGFGFIAAEDGSQLFFHVTRLVDCDDSQVTPGTLVRFDVGDGRKGPMAVNVEVLR